jgi:hypothetical protein
MELEFPYNDNSANFVGTFSYEMPKIKYFNPKIPCRLYAFRFFDYNNTEYRYPEKGFLIF